MILIKLIKNYTVIYTNRIKWFNLIFLYFLFFSYLCSALNQLKPQVRKFIHLSGKYAQVTPPIGSVSRSSPDINKYNSSNIPEPLILRVQQFNVLADGLSGRRHDSGGFSRVSPNVLEFEKRKHQLLHEILQYDADIVTLQECDHYYDFFLPELSKQGYNGYYAPKPTSGCLEFGTSDGTALFIKNSKFSVVSIETKTIALSIAELGEGGEVQEDDKSIKAQNQVAIIALCQIKDSMKYRQDVVEVGKPTKTVPGIIIATTHLKSSKTATGERHRAIGINQILNQVNKIYQDLEYLGKTPVCLLTGVLNAQPEPVDNYEPLTYRTVKSNGLGLRSVYNEDVPLSMQKLSSSFYTTWKARYVGSNKQEKVTKRVVDYIFYSSYQKGIAKNSIDDLKPSVTISSSNDIAIVFLLRFIIYFFLALIPFSSFLSTSLDDLDRIALFLFSGWFLILFETIGDGSIIKPKIEAVVRVEDPLEDDLKSQLALKTNYRSLFPFVSPKQRSLLNSVGKLSQRILPLEQYGRPGFQAISVLDVFSDEEIGDKCIPSEEYPSDHISLVADLQMLW